MSGFEARNETRDLLFAARNLVEGISRGVEDMEDERREMIQGLAAIAIEKLDAATGSPILDPPPPLTRAARPKRKGRMKGGLVAVLGTPCAATGRRQSFQS
jgi:hypothetical protein